MAAAFPRRRRWEELGRDLLLMVLSKLPTVDLVATSFVCSSWRDASSEPSLWRILDFHPWDFHRHRPQYPFPPVLRFSVSLSRGAVLRIRFPNSADDSDFHFVAQSCPELRYFYINSTSVSPDDFCSAVSKFRFLEGMAIADNLVNSEVLMLVPVICRGIHELRVLPGNGAVGLKTAIDIFKHFPFLKKLELNDCRVTHLAVEYLLDRLTQLEYLDISGRGRVTISASIIEKSSRLKYFIWDWVADEGELGDLVDPDGDSTDEGGPREIDIRFMERLSGS